MQSPGGWNARRLALAEVEDRRGHKGASPDTWGCHGTPSLLQDILDLPRCSEEHSEVWPKMFLDRSKGPFSPESGQLGSGQADPLPCTVKKQPLLVTHPLLSLCPQLSRSRVMALVPGRVAGGSTLPHPDTGTQRTPCFHPGGCRGQNPVIAQ